MAAPAAAVARRVEDPPQRSYGVLDIDIARNAYGTQIDSFEAVVETESGSPFAGLPCVLIRAPRITRCGPGVTVHACVHGSPALVSSGSVWAATFHPELTEDRRVLDAVLPGYGALPFAMSAAEGSA